MSKAASFLGHLPCVGPQGSGKSYAIMSAANKLSGTPFHWNEEKMLSIGAIEYRQRGGDSAQPACRWSASFFHYAELNGCGQRGRRGWSVLHQLGGDLRAARTGKLWRL